MKSEFTAYTEVVYKEQENGSVHWLGRVYNRVGGAKVLETHEGISPNKAEALVSAKEWSTTTLDSKYRDAPDLQVITSDDIGVINVKDLGLE